MQYIPIICKRLGVLLFATLLVFALSVPASASTVLYTQPYDGSGNLYASQNDTTGGNGNFATVYDNFTLATAATVTEVQWVGGYFNPGPPGTITGWTVNFYSDNSGQPGALASTYSVVGNGNELLLAGNIDSYDVNALNFLASAGTQYWLSVVPDIGFPPQWGWGTATGGDDISYQDFFGSRSSKGVDFAFTLKGQTAVPEPGTLVLLVTGMLGLAVGIRRKVS